MRPFTILENLRYLDGCLEEALANGNYDCLEEAAKVVQEMLGQCDDTEPTDAEEDLSRLLFLAITTPSHEQSQQAVELAEQIASGMTEEQVEAAKTNAMQLVGNMEATQ